MKLVYFGRKRPKIVKTVSPERFEMARDEDRQKSTGITYIALAGKALTYRFDPFREIEVNDNAASILLDKANDLFKCVDKDANVSKSKAEVKTNGYVGATHAERISDLDKKVKQEAKAEEGKSVEQIIGESRSKKEEKSKEE